MEKLLLHKPRPQYPKRPLGCMDRSYGMYQAATTSRIRLCATQARISIFRHLVYSGL